MDNQADSAIPGPRPPALPGDNPGSGVNYLLRGFSLLKAPEIRLYVIVPLIFNILIYALFMAWSLNKIGTWIDQLLGYIPEWLSFISWLLWPLFVLILLIMLIYTFTFVANLIASPFNGFLAEKVERLKGTKPPADNFTLRTMLMLVPHSLYREVAKLLLYLPWMIGIGILTLIPLLQVAAPVLWFILGAWVMAIQYVDYPMDNHGINLKIMKQKLGEKRLTAMGFGTAVMAGTLIPGLNLLIMPAAICGATLFWIEQLQD